MTQNELQSLLDELLKRAEAEGVPTEDQIEVLEQALGVLEDRKAEEEEEAEKAEEKEAAEAAEKQEAEKRT